MSINKAKTAEEATVSTDLEACTWPTAAADTDKKIALDDFLISLQLMATDAAREEAAGNSGWWRKTPPSMQVIRSGTQALSKWWIAITAGVGGLGGLATVVGTWIAAATSTIGTPVAIALIGSAALVLSATAIALALFVKADLDSRGTATAARNAGRAQVAAAFLSATARLPSRAPGLLSAESLLQVLAAFPDRVEVARKGGDFRLVANVNTSADSRLTVEVVGGDPVPIAEVDKFRTVPPTQTGRRRHR